MNKSQIKVTVTLNDQNVPESIIWISSDTGPEARAAKAINLAFWDQQTDGTMKIDVWTPEMPIEDMKRFYISTIGAMADTYVTATGDEIMGAHFRDLCRQLMEKADAEAAK